MLLRNAYIFISASFLQCFFFNFMWPLWQQNAPEWTGCCCFFMCSCTCIKKVNIWSHELHLKCAAQYCIMLTAGCGRCCIQREPRFAHCRWLKPSPGGLGLGLGLGLGGTVLCPHSVSKDFQYIQKCYWKLWTGKIFWNVIQKNPTIFAMMTWYDVR